jgi:hypothetical protein
MSDNRYYVNYCKYCDLCGVHGLVCAEMTGY